MVNWLKAYWEDEPVEMAAVFALLCTAAGIVFLFLATPERHRLEATRPSASATAASSDPTAPPSALQAHPSQTGETRQGQNADTTLLQFRRVLAPPDHAPSAGNQWLGIRARICAHPDAKATGKTGWTAWSVMDADGTRFDGANPPWADFPAQQLVTDGIEPGTCVVGWVLIDVPQVPVARFTQAVFLPGSAHSQTWEL